jgi:hypothetical protein
VEKRVNFCVNFLREFSMGFWTVNFGVNFGVDLLREFVHGVLESGPWISVWISA